MRFASTFCATNWGCIQCVLVGVIGGVSVSNHFVGVLVDVLAYVVEYDFAMENLYRWTMMLLGLPE